MRDIEEALLIERRRIAVEIISAVLSTSAPEEPDDPLPEDFRIESLAYLIRVTVPKLLHVQLALSSRAGMSWDAMATASKLGISRQAFHKRFSPGVNQYLDDAASGALTSLQSDEDWHAAFRRDTSIAQTERHSDWQKDEIADEYAGQLAEGDAAGIEAARHRDLYLGLLGEHWRRELPGAKAVWQERRAAKKRWWGY